MRLEVERVPGWLGLWSCDNSCTSPLTLAMARESPLLACNKNKSPFKIARLQHTVVLVWTARTQPIVLNELGHVTSALNCMGVLIPGQASLFCSYHDRPHGDSLSDGTSDEFDHNYTPLIMRY